MRIIIFTIIYVLQRIAGSIINFNGTSVVSLLVIGCMIIGIFKAPGGIAFSIYGVFFVICAILLVIGIINYMLSAYYKMCEIKHRAEGKTGNPWEHQ